MFDNYYQNLHYYDVPMVGRVSLVIPR